MFVHEAYRSQPVPPPAACVATSVYQDTVPPSPPEAQQTHTEGFIANEFCLADTHNSPGRPQLDVPDYVALSRYRQVVPHENYQWLISTRTALVLSDSSVHESTEPRPGPPFADNCATAGSCWPGEVLLTLSEDAISCQIRR